MNCPVCKTEIEFDLPALEELYYDCSNCQSSLLFKGGKCEVISEGKVREQVQDSLKEKTEAVSQVKEAQSKQTLQVQKSIPSSEENLQTENLKGDEDNQGLQELEPPAEDLQASLSEKQEEVSSQEEENLELKEEEFDSVTEVPEIGTDSEEIEEESSYPFQEHSQEVSSPESDTSIGSESSNEGQAEDFSEVADFAKNQDQENKGLYVYDLTLSEMNSQNLKDEVLSVLEDPYLNLSFNEEASYLEDIKEKGEISLSKVSPVQVYVIVHSLMGLPLKIHWKQHHVADP